MPWQVRTPYYVNKKIGVQILSTHIKVKLDHKPPEPQCLCQGQVVPESSFSCQPRQNNGSGSLGDPVSQIKWRILEGDS